MCFDTRSDSPPSDGYIGPWPRGTSPARKPTSTRARLRWAATLGAALTLALGGLGCGGESAPALNAEQKAVRTFTTAMTTFRLAAEKTQKASFDFASAVSDAYARAPGDPSPDEDARWRATLNATAALQKAHLAGLVAGLDLAEAGRHAGVQSALLGEAVEVKNGAKPLICGGLCVGGLIAGVSTYMVLSEGADKITGAATKPCSTRFATATGKTLQLASDAIGQFAADADELMSIWSTLSNGQKSKACQIFDGLLDAEAARSSDVVPITATEKKQATVGAWTEGGSTVVNGVVGAGMSVTGGPVGKVVEMAGGSANLANVVEVTLSLNKVNYQDMVGKSVEIQGTSKQRVAQVLPVPGNDAPTVVAAAKALRGGPLPADKQREAANVVMRDLVAKVDDAKVAPSSQADGSWVIQRPTMLTTGSMEMPAELVAKVSLPSNALDALILASEAAAPEVVDPPAPVNKKLMFNWKPKLFNKIGAKPPKDDNLAQGTGACANKPVYDSKLKTYDTNGKVTEWPAGTCSTHGNYYTWCATDARSLCSCREDTSAMTEKGLGTYLPEDTCKENCANALLGDVVSCDDSTARKTVTAAAKDMYIGTQGMCVCSEEYSFKRMEVCNWANEDMPGFAATAWKTCRAAEVLAYRKQSFMKLGETVCYAAAVETSARSRLISCTAGKTAGYSATSTCDDKDPTTFDHCSETNYCAAGEGGPDAACSATPFEVEKEIKASCTKAHVDKERCVAGGQHELDGVGAYDLTAKVRCTKKTEGDKDTYEVVVVKAAACKLQEQWQ
ncbi:MAG: hypothetical protein KC502_19920 [Myxococcales bacterium]|nr:hypothetical protein [Myxococcales bacterium]